jgi:hypothetical protein
LTSTKDWLDEGYVYEEDKMTMTATPAGKAETKGRARIRKHESQNIEQTLEDYRRRLLAYE